MTASERDIPITEERGLTGSGYVPSELRKGYQPKPPLEEGTPVPPPGPAGDFPVADVSTLPTSANPSDAPGADDA